MPLTACLLEVHGIEGRSPVRVHGTQLRQSGERGVADDGRPANRDGIGVRDGALDVSGEEVCEACGKALRALAAEHGFWRRLLARTAPAPGASTPRSPSASTSSSSAPKGRTK
jgi:hypothetical protein